VPGFVNYKKGCIRLAAASDKVYQLLAHGWWFSPGTPPPWISDQCKLNVSFLRHHPMTIHVLFGFSYVGQAFTFP
jgi:hypothetical protein